MPNFTAGTSFTDGVTNDVTAAKLNALIADAVPTSSLSLNSTTGTISQFSSGTGTAASPAIQPTGDTNTGIFFPAADTIAFSEGGTESMRIDSSGNVGIGTTSPTYKLDVQGNVGATISGKTAELNASGNSIYTSYNDGTKTWRVGSGIVSSGMFSIRNHTDSSNALQIDSSGNVGVGTTLPTNRLHIVNSGAGALALQTTAASSDQTQISFVGTTGNKWTIGNNAATGGTGTNFDIYDLASGANRLRIDSSGNVGIGTTGAVNKLEIVGSFGRGAPVTKTGDFTLADTENWIIVNKGSSCTVTLPAASSWTGREFTIKVITAHTVISASSNIVPRNSATAGTAILAATAGSWATLVSNGTNWVIMCGS